MKHYFPLTVIALIASLTIAACEENNQETPTVLHKHEVGKINLSNVTAYGSLNQKSQTVIILDDSGSMAGRFGTALDAVDSSISNFDNSHELSLFLLNQGWVSKSLPPEEFKKMFRLERTNWYAEGGTKIARALAEVDEYLSENGSGLGMNQILLITDGEADSKSASQQQLMKMHQNSDVVVSMINLLFTNPKIHIPKVTSQIDVSNIADLKTKIQPMQVEQASFVPFQK